MRGASVCPKTGYVCSAFPAPTHFSRPDSLRLRARVLRKSTLRQRDADWIYQTPKGREYTVTSVDKTNLSFHLLEGSEEPKGGWISYGYPVKQPRPQLCMTKHGRAPQHWITVIAPEGAEWTVEETAPDKWQVSAGGKKLLLTEESIEICP